MPSVRSLVFIYYILLATSISLNSEIISPYSYYTKRGLVYIIIIALFSCQPFSYTKCTKLNIRLSYNIYLVSNAECIFYIYFYTY